MNYLSVFVTTVVAFVIGALWYSPLLFGDAWKKLLKIKVTKKEMEAAMKGMWKVLLGGFFVTLILVFMLDLFMNFLNVVTFSQGVLLGFLIWLGFLATTMFNIVLYEKKPFKLYLINAGHYLAVLLISGGILAVWV